METEFSSLEENFKYVLVQVGSKLNDTNLHGIRFVHQLPKPPPDKDTGIYLMEEMVEGGFFDYLTPGNLKEILTKIGRKDLANIVKEYEKSSTFKQVKKQQEKERLAEELQGCSPERRRRDILPTAYTLATQLAEQATKLKEAIKKGMMEGEKKTNKTMEGITESHEKLEKFNQALKKSLTAAGVKLVTKHENVEAKKAPILIPAFLQQNNRAQSMDYFANDSIPHATSAATLPGSTRAVHYKLRATPSEPTPQSKPLDDYSMSRATLPATATPTNWPDKWPSGEGPLVRELEEGMRNWERKVSQVSLKTGEDDSGYTGSSWTTTLPAETRQSEKSEREPLYENIDLLSQRGYQDLSNITRLSHHEYVKYGTAATANRHTGQ